MLSHMHIQIVLKEKHCDGESHAWIIDSVF